ncbi:hypothetical protein PSECIP111951_03113 [Pseudoalteromonas holothuriae]|uniref:START domain-containing protein n=1 Tax=Pseudoalteromonas holothuriae TaxID=2963714 RepID=A0A9W4W040_9GAMM|nr:MULTISPECIES: START domain-containing protein [unclassified Pseudoalteromonas]CAH9059432.1 hypothetical protein PSECIP111854_02405 [Pseudoalteromonas sp. CIP111854]CAH9064360.1 hypothetical protein PSECIP111951_03113 [Pseudoalteromonas sp. CIP111951]
MALNVAFRFFVIALTALSLSPCFASQWQTWHKTSDLEISFLTHESGINYIEVNARFHGVTVNALLNVLDDTDNAPKWLSRSRSVEAIARPTSAQAIVYTYFDSPWPVRDRDMLTHSCLSQLSEMQYRLDIVSTQRYHVPKSNALRISPVKGFWLLTQTPTELKVKHQIYANPNGSLPHWLINSTALKSIRSSFKALKTVLQNPKYHGLESYFVAGDCDDFS